jgi:hypothetical protein
MTRGITSVRSLVSESYQRTRLVDFQRTRSTSVKSHITFQETTSLKRSPHQILAKSTKIATIQVISVVQAVDS